MRALPPESAAVLRPALPGIGEAILEAIRAEVPEYARPLTGTFGANVRQGVEVALRRFVDSLEHPGGAPAQRGREVYVGLGAGEAREGRSLDSLLSAYRVGARVAWRRLVDAATAGGLAPDAIYDLGEAVFAYIDEISAESAEGYAAEQSLVQGERERRRRALGRLLAADLPARLLAPLDDERPATRDKLLETLRAYLDEPGQPLRIAHRLGVHPQTVRYRLRRLRDLFPPGALEDPDRRFALALALRAP